jgi:hypothetical protein
MQVVADLRPAKLGGTLSARFASAAELAANETAAASKSIRISAAAGPHRRGANCNLETIIEPPN